MRILEVGCGTGKNLASFCRRFPDSDVVGVDLSAAMLERAGERIQPFGSRARLVECACTAPLAEDEPFDLVLFSYALSMFNPGFEVAIEAARDQVALGGHIAVVDFHASPWPIFERWMSVNHVRINGQLRPLLRKHFHPLVDELRPAYGGAWDYVVFVGRKQDAAANRRTSAG
jgi:S-adenosylmethionine-diacylgycerolhomoserine-N-methlytransferase